jgi:hypothetical protein
MPKVVRTLVICSLLMIGAAAPAVAAGDSQAEATAHSVHINGTTDGHVP